MDLLQRGMTWLATRLKSHATQPIVYRRGSASLPLRAVIGRRQLATVDEAGIQTVYHATDFLFPAADLDFGNGPEEPETGDRIEAVLEGRTITYEVLDETGGKHFEYTDPFRTMLRLHAKQTDPD